MTRLEKMMSFQNLIAAPILEQMRETKAYI